MINWKILFFEETVTLFSPLFAHGLHGWENCVLQVFFKFQSRLMSYSGAWYFSPIFADSIASAFYNEIYKYNMNCRITMLWEKTELLTYVQSIWIAGVFFYAGFDGRHIYVFFQWRRCFKYMNMMSSNTFKPTNTANK